MWGAKGCAPEKTNFELGLFTLLCEDLQANPESRMDRLFSASILLLQSANFDFDVLRDETTYKRRIGPLQIEANLSNSLEKIKRTPKRQLKLVFVKCFLKDSRKWQ